MYVGVCTNAIHNDVSYIVEIGRYIGRVGLCVIVVEAPRATRYPCVSMCVTIETKESFPGKVSVVTEECRSQRGFTAS